MKVLLTRIWLIFVAVYPILAACIQIVDFFLWLYDAECNFTFFAKIGSYSPFFLAISFIVSIREKFCVFHRLCILSVLLVNINHLWAILIPPVIANYITTVMLLAALTGIVGAIIHFAIQIKDFIEYVRIQSKKQDPYKGTLRA